MIPQDTVNKILDAAQIVDVVGDFVSLKKRGSNYIACCPFHNEKTPSFSVSPTKGIFKCFGCGKSGTVVGFVMEHENLTYVEALKYLAKRYHIEVVEKEETAEEIARKQKNESLLLVSEFAAGFFKESLKTQEGQAIAWQYFRSRGLEDATISKYGLGWSPSSRSALSEAARSAGYKEEFLVDTGLSIRYDDGRLVDRFYDRVMFPIHSVSGRVIAFGGRTLKSDKTVAKYVNSPETEIYVKSKSLYGLYFAKSEIAKKDRCILVEGYLDVLSMHQLGILNVVASSGTSLTVDQIRQIHKFTENITIIYDGDGAGIKAALRGIDLVLKEGMNVRIVLLPDGQDPDDFARRHTLDEVQEYISANEQDFIAFKTNLLLDEAGDDPLKKAQLINDISDTIALIPDPVIRAMYVRSTSQRFEVDEQILLNRINVTRSEMLAAEARQAERARMRDDAGLPEPPPPPMDEYADGPMSEPMPPAPLPEQGIVIEDKELAASERELLGFILSEGCSPLMFDRDSKFYVEGLTVSVAEFIDGILADDEASFVNRSYRKTYDAYFEMYDQGLEQEQIQRRLLDSMDLEIAAVAQDILIDKYQITVSSYEKSLTSMSTLLVTYVPRSLMTYQLKRVKRMLDELIARLVTESDPEGQAQLLTKIDELNRCRTRISNELGRV